ncbi:hypothetical protein IEQ34_017810 [Dendrobium chrysotoxum]|uniref:Uncharacterized protein n=1 Tax=Dendrobium chrysotoxum TaxID=161865 RepID=A0AAV7GBA8_DENCH|nr:hypothetical protein IEQ34_017810 [Dendrobium chrysotoxum]
MKVEEMFGEEPYAVVVNVIWEFFTNAKEAVENRCYVRGKWVPFDSHTINRLYKLKILNLMRTSLFI